MLLSQESDTGERLLSERTLSMMHANRLPQDTRHTHRRYPAAGLRLELDWPCDGGCGTSLINLRNKGRIWLAGAAGTYFWVDPKAEITGVIMTQFIRSNFPLSDDMMTVFYGAVQGR